MTAGQALNQNVLNYALAGNTFDAVPEPGTLGLLGLGAAALLAAAARRRRREPSY
jgi:hypothetical protein